MEEITTKTNKLLVSQVQKLNTTMQRVIDDFEAEKKQKIEVKELLKMNDTLNKLIHDKFSYMQDQVEHIKWHIKVLRSNQSVLESEYEELVREMAEAITETAKELERKHDLLMSQVVSLESHISDLNSSIEWIVDEITALNQQVNPLVLPRYRMPLLLRRQDNYMVSAPFYTKDEGYRMRALAHPKNNNDNLRMVVCLCVLQGKYDQTLQWPPDVRFSLTLYMNGTTWKTEEVTFPSDKNSDHSFINSTKNFFMINDGSCVEYEIKRRHNINATVFHLDIIRKSSWWEFALQVIDFMIQCSVYLWYVMVTLSPFWCFYLGVRVVIEAFMMIIVEKCKKLRSVYFLWN